MEPLAIELTDRLTDLRPSAGDVPIYSTVVGGPADGGQFDAAYWGRNLCQPVRFTQAVASLLEAGVSVFVELSPHPLLTPGVAAERAGGRARGHHRRVRPPGPIRPGVHEQRARAIVGGRRGSGMAALLPPKREGPRRCRSIRGSVSGIGLTARRRPRRRASADDASSSTTLREAGSTRRGGCPRHWTTGGYHRRTGSWSGIRASIPIRLVSSLQSASGVVAVRFSRRWRRSGSRRRLRRCFTDLASW